MRSRIRKRPQLNGRLQKLGIHAGFAPCFGLGLEDFLASTAGSYHALVPGAGLFAARRTPSPPQGSKSTQICALRVSTYAELQLWVWEDTSGTCTRRARAGLPQMSLQASTKHEQQAPPKLGSESKRLQKASASIVPLTSNP